MMGLSDTSGEKGLAEPPQMGSSRGDERGEEARRRADPADGVRASEK